MSLTTLRRYLQGDSEQDTLRGVISLLLREIPKHAVKTDEEEYLEFRNDLARFVETMQKASMPQLLVLAGSAIQTFEKYNQRTARFVRMQGSELQLMIAMLSQTVITIGTGGDRSVQALGQIKDDLEHAVALEDVQKAKMRLSDCLEKVREESARQKAEAEATVLQLQEHIERTQNSIASHRGDMDMVTGLPGQAVALAAFEEAAAKPGRKFVVIAIVDRLETINSRFGRAVGDEVLNVLREHFQKHLQKSDRMFRWAGPALVALCERQDHIDRVRSEVKRMQDVRLEKTVEAGSRSSMIPITTSWSVIGLIQPVSSVSNHINKLVANLGMGL